MQVIDLYVYSDFISRGNAINFKREDTLCWGYVKVLLKGNGHCMFSGTSGPFEYTEENLSYIAAASYRIEIRSVYLNPSQLHLL